jgi:hypothetical protein
MKNAGTNNVALFEIRKPTTELLQRREYRGGVYGPSKELSGAVAQVLDQRYQLTHAFAYHRSINRTEDIESYAVQACVIIGQTPLDDPLRTKSFELFRNNLSGVRIVTFDELLRSVEALRDFLVDERREFEAPESDNPQH